MKAFPATLSSYVDAAAGGAGERAEIDARTAIVLWTAAATFTKLTGQDEGAFADAAMRLYAGVFAKLDREAAQAYLRALEARIAPDIGAEALREAEQLRRRAWARLRAAMQLAEQPVGGRA